MEAETQRTADEVKHLKACLNDLISVVALPAIWRGGEPPEIVSTLLDVLLGMLGLDFVYARLRDPAGGAPSRWSRPPTPHLRRPSRKTLVKRSTPGWQTIRTRRLWRCEIRPETETSRLRPCDWDFMMKSAYS